MSLEKGMEVLLQGADISHEGDGIGRADGLVVFVPGLLPGDTAKVRITQVKKRFAKGELLEIVEAGEGRIDPLCPYHDICGGCTFGALDYETELAVKGNQVVQALTRIGGVERDRIKDPVGLTEPYRYRNKATMPVSTGGNHKEKGGILVNDGPPAVGFYRKHSHEVVDCGDCLLQSPAAVVCAEVLRQFMLEDNISAFDERWNLGLLRHLVVRTSEATGEVMVILVINGKGIPNAEKLIMAMDEALEENGYSLESVYINTNTENTTEVYGKEMKLLAGKPTIEERMGDMVFEVSPRSFYQTNPAIAEAVYDQVLAFAGLTGTENVLDLYCGVGTIGLWLSSLAGKVLGIEVVPEAILDANRNAVINGIVNARFLAGKAEEVLPALLRDDAEDAGKGDPDGFAASVARDADVVILDPPRKGCHPALLNAVMDVAPKKIVYVSCDPATLARDIAYMKDEYTVEEAIPFDMFPRTGHVECVVLMSKAST